MVNPFVNLIVVWNRGISYGLFQQHVGSGSLDPDRRFGHRRCGPVRVDPPHQHSRFLAVSLALIVGGAIGNVIDRWAYGAVFDFIQIQIGDWSWYVFNVADAAIVAGVVGLLYDSFVLERRRAGLRPPCEIAICSPHWTGRRSSQSGNQQGGCHEGNEGLWLRERSGAPGRRHRRVGSGGRGVKSFLGTIGIIPKEKPPINYSERAPLVLPPKMELRAPAAPRSAENQANWPKDPDVVAARKAAAEARAPATSTEIYRSNRSGVSIDRRDARRPQS